MRQSPRISARPGGFKVLNVSDEAEKAAGSQFFEKINRPFFDAAIKRKDDIALASIPLHRTDIITSSDELKGMYARELEHLARHNYKPINISNQQWANIKDWVK